MKKIISLCLALCVLFALAIPAGAAGNSMTTMGENTEIKKTAISKDELLKEDTEFLAKAEVTREDREDGVSEFYLTNQEETRVSDTKSEITCTAAKIIAMDEQEADQVEKEIEEIQRVSDDYGTVSQSYLDGTVLVKTTTYILVENFSGYTCYKINGLKVEVTTKNRSTYGNQSATFIQKGTSAIGQPMNLRQVCRAAVISPNYIDAPKEWAFMRKTWDGDIGAILNFTVKKSSGSAISCTLPNYYF